MENLKFAQSLGDKIRSIMDIGIILPISSNGATRRIALKKLTPDQIDIPRSYAKLIEYVDIENLTHLCIKVCLNIQPLFESLQNCFTRRSPPLKHLGIYLPLRRCDLPNNVVYTIEQLLLFFSGLQELHLYMNKSGIVSKESIIRHAGSLHTLGVGRRKGMPNNYPPADLMAILDSCTRLV